MSTEHQPAPHADRAGSERRRSMEREHERALAAYVPDDIVTATTQEHGEIVKTAGHPTRVETRTICTKCGQQLGLFHKRCDGTWIEQRRIVTEWFS